MRIVSPTEKSKMRKHLLIRREGLTLFDEDNVCDGYWDPDTAHLNYNSGKLWVRS